MNRSKILPLALAASAALMAGQAQASSHSEAPYIKSMPKVDGTDFYMFRSYEPGRADFVTLIANYWPLQAPFGGPSYFTMDPNALYEIHIDNDGDAIEDITYQFQFDNALANGGAGTEIAVNGDMIAVPLEYSGPITATDKSALNMLQTYTVTKIDGDRRTGPKSTVTWGNNSNFPKPYDNVGNKTFPDYDAYVSSLTNSNAAYFNVALPGCTEAGRIFVGQRQDSFSIGLGEIFDLINLVPLEGSVEQDVANNDLEPLNITTFAMELPISCVTGTGNGVIGAWTTASVRQVRVVNPNASFTKPEVVGGAWTQVSRLGAPLVNEVVIGLPDKDQFNASEPVNDADPTIGFGKYVFTPTLPELIEILFAEALTGSANGDVAPNNFPRNDLVAAFLTGVANVNQLQTVTAAEMLRLNTAIAVTPQSAQSNLGVAGNDLAGFPNGRRPGDDEVDIALRVVMGALCHDIPVNGVPTNLGFCMPEDAPQGDQPFTDGAPQNADRFANSFPYLNSPLPGSPRNEPESGNSDDNSQAMAQ